MKTAPQPPAPGEFSITSAIRSQPGDLQAMQSKPTTSYPRFESRDQARRLRDYLDETGFNLSTLSAKLGSRIAPPTKAQRNLPLLLHQTRESTPLNLLVRWFIIGESSDESTARAVIPAGIVDLLVTTRMLDRRDGKLAPTLLLLPFVDVLTASDFAPGADPPADLVIGPNSPARLLMNFTIRRKVGAALDLCCGGGVQAIKLAAHSDSVTATDLNERAIEFARFNALLNGAENIECIAGDCFRPVEGRRFDLIVANPPFFLLPANDLLYRDNPMELDGFVRALARDAPNYLNEGGIFQMIFEWAEIEGEPWHQRLAEWVSDLGCDVWILKDSTSKPVDYSDMKLRSTEQRSSDDDIATLTSWAEYYRQKNVIAMHGGVMALRKRATDTNWVEIEEISVTLRDSFGDIVERFFDDHDLVAHGSDDEILELRPRLSPYVRLEQVFNSSSQGWQQPSMLLKVDHGLQRSCGVDAQIAGLLSHCDGLQRVEDLLGTLTPREGADMSQVREGCLAVMRQLIRRGFVLAR